jgi:hypothetical protein
MKKLELKDLAELIEFRKPFIKEKYIMYLNYRILEDAILKNQIFGEFENYTLVGYVWFINLVRKPFCKIEEICSKNKGGIKLLKFAELHSKHEVIRLSVVDFNSKAISFYERNNFLQVEKREGKITNIIMEKNIYESRNI